MACALVTAGRGHDVPKSYYLRGGAGWRMGTYESFITAPPGEVLEVSYSSREVVTHQLHPCGPLGSHRGCRATMSLVLSGGKAGDAVPLPCEPWEASSRTSRPRGVHAAAESTVEPEEVPGLVLNHFRHTYTQSKARARQYIECLLYSKNCPRCSVLFLPVLSRYSLCKTSLTCEATEVWRG